MYCYYNVLPEGYFYCLLVNNIVYIIFFGGTYLQRIFVFIQNFKFGVMVLAIQLFNKIKQNLKKHVSLYIIIYFPCYVKIIYVW